MTRLSFEIGRYVLDAHLKMVVCKLPKYGRKIESVYTLRDPLAIWF